MAVLDGWVLEEVTMLWTCRCGRRCRSERACLLELWERASRALSDLSLSLSLSLSRLWRLSLSLSLSLCSSERSTQQLFVSNHSLW